jgi:hypothetical protein
MREIKSKKKKKKNSLFEFMLKTENLLRKEKAEQPQPQPQPPGSTTSFARCYNRPICLLQLGFLKSFIFHFTFFYP